MQVLILMGPPGGGKGTVAGLLKRKLSVAHLSTGEMLRDEVSKGSELGKQIKEIIDNGKLVSDNIMEELISIKINNPECKNGFILDGYPRNINQAKSLDSLFEKNRINTYKVFEIAVAEDIIVKRILGRFMCAKCSAIYNKFFSPTKQEGICDVCGSKEFITRKDDNLDTIKKRLQIYSNETTEVLSYYKKNNKHYLINGEQDTTNVLSEIVNLLS
ncbi:adenylate kinase [Rickettsiales bacterium LUAb2]